MALPTKVTLSLNPEKKPMQITMHARHRPEFKGRIVPIGQRGSGKTTIAEIVAEQPGTEPVNTDDVEDMDRHLHALGWTEREQERALTEGGPLGQLDYLVRLSVPLLKRLAHSSDLAVLD